MVRKFLPITNEWKNSFIAIVHLYNDLQQRTSGKFENIIPNIYHDDEILKRTLCEIYVLEDESSLATIDYRMPYSKSIWRLGKASHESSRSAWTPVYQYVTHLRRVSHHARRVAVDKFKFRFPKIDSPEEWLVSTETRLRRLLDRLTDHAELLKQELDVVLFLWSYSIIAPILYKWGFLQVDEYDRITRCFSEWCAYVITLDAYEYVPDIFMPGTFGFPEWERPYEIHCFKAVKDYVQ